MSSPKTGNFCVYSTLETDLTLLVQTLNEGQFGNPPSEKQWTASPQPFLDQPVSAIIEHHRTHPGVFNKQYFVIADRPDWTTSGILAVNLDFQGFVDAARMMPSVAGDAIPSVSVASSDWYDIPGTRTDGMYPKRKFAVYASEGIFGKVKEEKSLLEALNAGLESRKDVSVEVCRIAPWPLPAPKGVDDEVDVSPVAEKHTQIARDEDFDKTFFVMADEVDWDHYGVIIVRVSEDGAEADTCRKPVDIAAEVLTWQRLGLYNWEDGKLWDEDRREIEED